MPTNRTRRRRPQRTPAFTSAAINAFRRMQEPEISSEEWTAQQWIIHDELRLQPWERAVQDPEATPPYPEGTYAFKNWKPDLEAQARWRALEEAVRG